MKHFLPPLALLLAATLAACAPHPTGNEAPAERAGPAYVLWLEQQSMLREASRLTGIVSGSALSWRYSSKSSPLPAEACTWLRADDAFTARRSGSFFSALTSQAVPARVAALGIHGLYLGGTADTGDEWLGRPPLSGLGDDACGLTFGRNAGSDDDYEALLTALSQNGLLAGGSLLPAHTGMGPDFFLSLRAVRDYPGLYAMTELPKECWELLPEVSANAPFAVLDEATAEALSTRGVLPEALIQDSWSIDHQPGGWAVTAETVGVDGAARRWAYRWHGSPARPVLHWDDPSGTARRTMEASLILQSGLRHQALAGLSAGAWAGLDARPPASAPEDLSLEPARSAAAALRRNAHRYGTALLLEDAFPPDLLPLLQRGSADFLRDTVTSPALEQAMLCGSAAPLRETLRRSLELGIRHRGLWRKPADGREAHAFAPLQSMIPADWTPFTMHGGGVRATAPVIAAMACGLPPGQSPAEGQIPAVQDAHLLQIAFRAMLPGLLMLSGSDLSGTLPDCEDWPSIPPSWILEVANATPHGLPAGRALYRGGNGPQGLTPLLALRSSLRVSEGTLLAVPETSHDAVAAAVTALPDGRRLALFANFSGNDARFTPRYAPWAQASERIDASTGASIAAEKLHLPGWGWMAVVFS